MMPNRYRVYVREEVLESDFIDQFRDVSMDHLKPVIDAEDIGLWYEH
jgi:hypothetical protein